ncbi:MAG: hypothetical protein FWE37_08030, partial [Spirochaetaceae bacterium]|nr:hypothetical protein [Spirochaetaceae bacterium]
ARLAEEQRQAEFLATQQQLAQLQAELAEAQAQLAQREAELAEAQVQNVIPPVVAPVPQVPAPPPATVAPAVVQPPVTPPVTTQTETETVEPPPIRIAPPPPVPAPQTMTVTAPVGETVAITLSDASWYPAVSALPLALEFLRKDHNTQTGEASFIFRARQAGTYQLAFRRNLPNGIEEIVVTLVIAEAVPAPSALPPAIPETAAPPQVVQPDSGSFIEAAINNNTPQTLLSRQNEVIAAAATMTAGELAYLLRYTTNQTELIDLSDELLQSFIRRFPNNNDAAELLFRLGQFFENNDSRRNMQRAYSFYQQAYQNYPLSPFSRLSRERMDFLNRFFIRIP